MSIPPVRIPVKDFNEYNSNIVKPTVKVPNQLIINFANAPDQSIRIPCQAASVNWNLHTIQAPYNEINLGSNFLIELPLCLRGDNFFNPDVLPGTKNFSSQHVFTVKAATDIDAFAKMGIIAAIPSRESFVPLNETRPQDSPDCTRVGFASSSDRQAVFFSKKVQDVEDAEWDFSKYKNWKWCYFRDNLVSQLVTCIFLRVREIGGFNKISFFETSGEAIDVQKDISYMTEGTQSLLIPYFVKHFMGPICPYGIPDIIAEYAVTAQGPILVKGQQEEEMPHPILKAIIAYKGDDVIAFPKEQHRSIAYVDFLTDYKLAKVDEKKEEVIKKKANLVDHLKTAAMLDKYDTFLRICTSIKEQKLNLDQILTATRDKLLEIRIHQTKTRSIGNFQKFEKKFREANQPAKK